MQDTSGNSNRGRSMFTNALEPAEWSFSTYARPVFESSAQTAVEEVLWAFFLGAQKLGTLQTRSGIKTLIQM